RGAADWLVRVSAIGDTTAERRGTLPWDPHFSGRAPHAALHMLPFPRGPSHGRRAPETELGAEGNENRAPGNGRGGARSDHQAGFGEHPHGGGHAPPQRKRAAERARQSGSVAPHTESGALVYGSRLG